jgi:hypothetical protein
MHQADRILVATVVAAVPLLTLAAAHAGGALVISRSHLTTRAFDYGAVTPWGRQ